MLLDYIEHVSASVTHVLFHVPARARVRARARGGRLVTRDGDQRGAARESGQVVYTNENRSMARADV